MVCHLYLWEAASRSRTTRRSRARVRDREIVHARSRMRDPERSHSSYAPGDHHRTWLLHLLEEEQGLGDGHRVLDIGCAKGFLLHDLRQEVRGLTVVGLDISPYALTHAMDDVRSFVVQGTAQALPFCDRSFDLVVAINTLHNLDRPACIEALGEIERVSRGGRYVQVDSWFNDQQRESLMKWLLTALTFCEPEGWRRLFAEAGYTGDYYWTITD